MRWRKAETSRRLSLCATRLRTRITSVRFSERRNARGAHGVVIPKRRSVGLTAAVGKASAGAVEYVPVARVTNIAVFLEEIKARGVWVYAADMDGTDWCQTDFSGPAALVVGSEGFGVSRLVKEKSDFIVSLPMKGRINSLNASVACGVLCYEIARQRAGIKAKG